MRARPWLLGALLVAGCGHAPKAGPGFWADHPFYLDYGQFAGVPFPGPPPAGSAEDRLDLRAVRDWQAKRAPQDCARAAWEIPPDFAHLFRGVGVFPTPLPSAARAFFWRVRSDAAHATTVLKTRFKHPRPYARDEGIEPCVKKESEDSYPSGHAMIARVFAHILAALVPERRAQFFRRADEVASGRVAAGVHYPSDIEAGKALADEFYKRLAESPAFAADIRRVRRLASASPPPRLSAEPLVLDTDSAYFADDGLALAMLLQNPERFPLEGMTLVAGNYAPLQGQVYMSHVLKLMRREDVPFYLGASAPLRNNAERVKEMKEKWHLGFAGAFGRAAPVKERLAPPAGGSFSGLKPRPQDAVEQLIERLERPDEPLTVLAIGPLTNLALALQRKPQVARGIERLVFMGGNVRVPGNVTPDAEFNFWFDPEAAKIVLDAPIREKVMIGLDLTNQAPIDRARFDELTASSAPLSALLRDDLGAHYPYFLKDPKATRYIWDAVAAAYLVDPSIATRLETQYLEVITEFGPRYGGVRIKPRKDATAAETPVTVLTGLDFERLFALLKKALAWQP